MYRANGTSRKRNHKAPPRDGGKRGAGVSV
jgi:hypothetical protein